jgi:hypothetical protein
MTKTIYTLLIAMLLSVPSVCFSSFLIELNNGNEYITDQYWESGNDIEFNYFGGIVSMSKDSIIAIAESDKPYYEAPTSVESRSASDNASGELRADSGDGGKEAKQKEQAGNAEEEVDLQEYKAKNLELKDGLGSSLRALRDSSRNRDKIGKKYARKRIVEYSSQLYALTDKLKERNGGVLPADWWEGSDKL